MIAWAMVGTLGLTLIAAADPTVEEIFERASAQCEATVSFHVRSRLHVATGDVDVGNWNDASYYEVNDVEYTADGAKFRAAFSINVSDSGGGPGENLGEIRQVPIELAYDGIKSQLYSPDSGMLHVAASFDAIETANDVKPHAVPATLEPYRFLIVNRSAEPEDFQRLRSPDTWNALVAFSHVVADATVDGRACSVVEIATPEHAIDGVAIIARVFFEKAAGYFPVQFDYYRADTGQTIKRHEVDELTAFEAPNGDKAFIATKGHTTTWRWDDSSRRVSVRAYEIDASSYAFNHGIDPGVFTFSPASAAVIIDHDLEHSVAITRDTQKLIDATAEDLAPQKQNDREGSVEPRLPDRAAAADQEPGKEAGRSRGPIIAGLTLLIVALATLVLKKWAK